MHDMPELLHRPGVYHTMFVCGPHTPAQDAWLDQTCELLEAFVVHSDLDVDARPIASLAVHVAADFLFDRHAARADWAELQPAALASRFVTEMGSVLPEMLGALSAFFVFMVTTARIESARGRYLAAYFLALAEIHARTGGCRPARAERRAAASIARRHTPS
jgi:hypothetical protein